MCVFSGLDLGDGDVLVCSVMSLGHLLAGLVVGFLAGLTGVGGGSLLTPMLLFLFRVKPVLAVGTDLLFAALTKSLGALVHHRKHQSVDFRVVGLLTTGSLPGAAAALWFLSRATTWVGDLNRLVSLALGVALILVSLSQFFRGTLIRFCEGQFSPKGERLRLWQAPLTIGVGVVLGVLVTLSSVGAGALGTIAVLLLYPRLPTVKVVGTDLAFAVPLTALAGLGHLSLGNVDVGLLGGLLIGSLPGIWLGSLLSSRLPDRVLRTVLATALLLAGVRVLL